MGIGIGKSLSGIMNCRQLFWRLIMNPFSDANKSLSNLRKEKRVFNGYVYYRLEGKGYGLELIKLENFLFLFLTK